jgi:exodeoxyribonuclease-3
MRILSWNVNGLRAVEKKGFLEWFTRESPDVLCLQETKLSSEDQVPASLKQVEGYGAYFLCAERKGYSGVAIYTKTQPELVTSGFNVYPIDIYDKEGRVLVADYGEFLLFNVYFPNGRSSAERLAYKLQFYDAFLAFIEGRTRQGRNVVVCGDVNTAHKEIDLARPKANEDTSGFLPEERAWIDKLLARGYVDTFRVFNQAPGNYSYWDQMSRARERNVGWRIDYFFVNEAFADRVKAAYILPDVIGSDHCPVGIEIS